MAKKIYLGTLKSVLGRSIIHYYLKAVADAVDAFLLTWNNSYFYMSPFSLYMEHLCGTLAKKTFGRTKVVVMVADWPAQY